MFFHYFYALLAMGGMFVCFLVLGKSINNAINHIAKLDYLLDREIAGREEELEFLIRTEEFAKKEKSKQRGAAGSDEAAASKRM
jgi:hypothetical protein